MKLVLAVLLASLSLPAYASCTHTFNGPTAVITCSTGTESTLTQSSVEGLPLDGAFFSKAPGGIVVHAETAGTMTASTLACYVQNSQTGQWNRNPDLDLTVQALARQAWLGLAVPAHSGRIVWLPNGTGVATTIYITPSY